MLMNVILVNAVIRGLLLLQLKNYQHKCNCVFFSFIFVQPLVLSGDILGCAHDLRRSNWLGGIVSLLRAVITPLK